ncbi:hypothetical protein CASFOL_014907 [Castilleja foliolosa]|uniref:Uncharacterized protein n=1 Tax=Castilleja foliolosa TaxID=1961234 RepID=A0ABD3DFS2_9LAMI
MACYAAVVSLKETIERLLSEEQHSKFNAEIIEFALDEVRTLLTLLQKLDVLVENKNDSIDMYSDEWDRLNSLSQVLKSGRSSQSRRYKSVRNGSDGKMREAARELEDALETHLLNQLDFQALKQDVDSFSRAVKELMEEYTKEGDDEDEEEENRVVDVDDDLGGNEMVGYSDVLGKMKDELLFDNIMAVSVGVLVGMAGMGKTTLARAFFDDPKVLSWYDYRVWINVGPDYRLIDIVLSILNQVDPNSTTGNILTEGDELVSHFHETLKGRRCLVVLDDVWNKEVIPPVRELLQKANFRHPGYHLSMVLVTSRLEKIGTDAEYPWYVKMIKLRFMNKEESWDLLHHKVFGEGSSSSCTPDLAKAGKNIAENCEGLPLMIVTVADILTKANEMSPQYWNQVAEGQNSVFVDAYEQMSKVLLRSYEFLPRYLKDYFLYMGVFPQKYDIPISKLALLWGVEGCFLLRASKNFKDLQGHVSKHMEELIGKSLVLVRKSTFKQKPKTYGLHSALWHACVGEAGKNKFFHVFNKYSDCLVEERTRNQRRLCVHNNILFSIEEARNLMASISTSRSLLCNGPHHRYPVPICFDNLRLLRVIDALTIRFYEFPIEVLELVRLRYLALTCDGKIPDLISNLSNLEILIIHRYFNIVKLQDKNESSYLPMEIWDMKELQHLEVMGADLLEPRPGALLPNLVTLLDANARSCTKGVLKGLPKLKKLRIRIELSVDDDAEPLSISCQSNKPESLKCVVVNPVFRRAPLVSSLIFPASLKRLSLNGLGCFWEDVNKAVALLPKLEVLKLRCYAFRGAKWDVPEKGFRSLELLVIEDTDLVCWTVGKGSFSRLQCLVLKECYKLQDIQPGFRKPLNRIEITDCSPSAVACVKKMQAKRSTLEVYVDSSWDDGKKLKA